MYHFFGNDAEEIKVFEGVALKIEDCPFAIVEDEEVAKKFNAKPKSVVIFKKFDEKRNDLEIVKEKELNDFSSCIISCFSFFEKFDSWISFNLIFLC